MVHEHIPEAVQALISERLERELSWPRDRDFIVERVLSHGNWDAIQWARARVGDEAIRELIVSSRGRRLSPRQLRFWQVILDLPSDDVDRWISARERREWDRRTA